MKYSFFKEDLKGPTLYFFGLIFQAPLQTFEAVRSYLLRFSDATLIFQTRSLEYIRIVKTQPETQFCQHQQRDQTGVINCTRGDGHIGICNVQTCPYRDDNDENQQHNG